MVNREAVWQSGKPELAEQKRGGVAAGRGWERAWWGHLHRKERTALFQGAEREQCGLRVEAGVLRNR